MLAMMEESIQTFHRHKDVCICRKIRDYFNIPKLHFASHYVHCIKLHRTNDNFNAEYSQRHRIDLAKDACHTTNHTDEYSQVTKWLESKGT